MHYCQASTDYLNYQYTIYFCVYNLLMHAHVCEGVPHIYICTQAHKIISSITDDDWRQLRLNALFPMAQIHINHTHTHQSQIAKGKRTLQLICVYNQSRMQK